MSDDWSLELAKALERAGASTKLGKRQLAEMFIGRRGGLERIVDDFWRLFDECGSAVNSDGTKKESSKSNQAKLLTAFLSLMQNSLTDEGDGDPLAKLSAKNLKAVFNEIVERLPDERLFVEPASVPGPASDAGGNPERDSTKD